jgi:DNA-binding NarL/FixJ family response regulator
MKNNKKVLLIIPSKIVARGLEALLAEHGEFRVEGILSDLSHSSERMLRNMDADVIILDPQVFDFISRNTVRQRLNEYSSAAVVALSTISMDEEQKKQYDGIVDMYDSPVSLVNTLRAAPLLTKTVRNQKDRNFRSERRKSSSVWQRVCSTRRLQTAAICLSIRSSHTARTSPARPA